MKTLTALIHHQYDRLMPEIEATQQALAAHGIRLEMADYESLGDPLPEGDAYLLQGMSGYHEDYAGFMETMKLLEASGKPCFNSPVLVRWNSDKIYMRELEEKGIATLPTLWADSLEPSLMEKAAANGWKNVVVKPTISAGAFHTIKLASSDSATWDAYLQQAPKDKALMVQPFASEVVEEGEWSFLFFNGKFSHSLLKTAKAGDYRIQHVHGGGYVHLPPPPELLKDAQTVISLLPEIPLYGRVDGIRRDGRLYLMEVELIEPFLYMLPDRQAVENYSAALAGAFAAALGFAAVSGAA